MNAAPESGLPDTRMTPQEQYGGMLRFFLGFLHLKKWSTFNSIVLDWAATLFTPETPKVFFGLYPPSHLYSDEKIMSEFRFFSELSL